MSSTLTIESDVFAIVTEGIQGPPGAQGISGVADPNIRTGTIVVTFDGGDLALTTGDARVNVVAPFTGTIVGWHLVCPDAAGSVVIDVWKATGAKPTNANSIAGTEKPTLASQDYASDLSLTTWQTAVTKGDIFGFEIESVSGIRKATLTLEISRT